MIDEERVWLTDGLAERRKLIALWRENFSSIAIEVECSEEKLKLVSEKKEKIPLMTLARQDESGSNVRGLFDLKSSLTLQVNSFGDKTADCISFLQIAHKSLTILGFTFRIRLFGKNRKGGFLESALQQLGWGADREGSSDEPRIEFLVEDALKCEWAVVSVEDLRRKGLLRLTVWIERNLALLLEKDNDNDNDYCKR
jgi:hypothetical protein